MDNFRVGDIIDDRYEVLVILGKGGMGVVYKTSDTILSRVIALKTLLPTFVRNKQALIRFINEAKVSLKLTHPNIIRVYDIRKMNSLYYITMEYIKGHNLNHWLKQHPARDPKQILGILTKVCSALDYAHHSGTFHRDIKPSNIMLTDTGKVFIVDFGLAKMADGVGDLTRLGGAGTPNYMAPEQKKGGGIDHRVDIYATGVMAFEMFTGQLPKLTQASQINRKLNRKVDEVLSNAISDDPSDRYGSMLTFIEDLKAALAIPSALINEADATQTEDATVTDGDEKTFIAVTEPTSRPKPKPETLRDMNQVPGGHCWIGSSPGESKNETEKPRHRVYVATFYIDKFPVTNEKYLKFIEATGNPEPPFFKDPTYNNATQPVVGVSWYDAMEYAKWAQKRLPTEAEWEKAAKGESGLTFPWGDEFSAERANVDFFLDRTSPVDQFSDGAGTYGCFDMIGNVWEWCLDWFDGRYYSISPTENPQGPKNGKKKVIRGGAWDTIYLNARCAFRFFSDPTTKSANIGFRCAVDG